MASFFCVSVRFFGSAFHGRRDGGAIEWPPSPLRVFQAFVRTAAALAPDATLGPDAQDGLGWLERQRAPTIVAPTTSSSTGYRLSVPNNAMDIVARAWSRGNYSNTGDASEATHRTMKPVRPTLLLTDEPVHYAWALQHPVSQQDRAFIGLFGTWARSLVAIGWGLDLVAGEARIISTDELAAFSGVRWNPATSAYSGLTWRIPTAGTLRELLSRHQAFLTRIGPNGFTAPPPLTTYGTVDYRKETDRVAPAIAAFSLLKLDASSFRPFDTVRSALTVAGMTRHLVKRAAHSAGWSEERINRFVLGHVAENARTHVAVGSARFAYFPLPSVERRTPGTRLIGSVRRVLVSTFADECREEVQWARRALSGHELIDETSHQPVAMLGLVPSTDPIVRQYTQPAAQWASVTPVVLPGYDDPAHYRRRLQNGVGAEQQKELLLRLDERVDALLRKAIVQAGFSEVLASHAELTWRKEGFWRGNDLADRYGVPDHLRRFPRYHVRIRWRDTRGRPIDVPGPVCFGGGRFLGVGLCASI